MKTFFCGLFACLTLLASPCGADKKEWISLFNGTNLDGWRVSENKDSVRVEDGLLVLHGPRAHVFYVGEEGDASFKNFHFKAKVKTTPGSNSGIYFHTEYQEEGWPQRGYEAQVNNTHRDPKKTGGLYSIQDNFKAPVDDNVWFDYEILVQGKQIVIKINDEVVSDYTEPEDLNRPERQLSQGTFALQAHDPRSLVYFKELAVKRLD